MTRADLLVAVQEQHGVQVNFLGSLLWYTVVDCRITKDDLEDLFAQAGLDSAHLPSDINPRDAFRRASRKMETAHKVDLGNNQYLNTLVREVSLSRNNLTRQVVREIVDSANKRLEYTPVAELVHKVSSTNQDSLEINIKDTLLEAEQKVLDALPLEYELNKLNYNGNNIRELVGKVLSDCDPVNVRPSGGVYFISAAYDTTIKALQAFVKELTPFAINGTRSTMHTVPVVDAEEQRLMIRESLEEQIGAASKALIGEMTDLIRTGKKVSTKAASAFADRARKLKGQIKAYEETLAEKQIGARANLEVAMKQALMMFELVED